MTTHTMSDEADRAAFERECSWFDVGKDHNGSYLNINVHNAYRAYLAGIRQGEEKVKALESKLEHSTSLLEMYLQSETSIVGREILEQRITSNRAQGDVPK